MFKVVRRSVLSSKHRTANSIAENTQPAAIHLRTANATNQKLERRADGGDGRGPQGRGASGGAHSGASVWAGPDLDPSRGPLIEQLIPSDQDRADSLATVILERDPVAGTAAELYSQLPYSDFHISDVGDTKVEQIYNDMFESLGVLSLMPPMSLAFLSYGRFCGHLLFDEALGYWSDMIFQDLGSVDVTPIPIMGAPFLVDLVPKRASRLVEFITSKDPRMKPWIDKVDPVIINKIINNETIQLNPDNTVYIPRMMFPNQYRGLSIFARLLYFLVFEWSIIDTTIMSAKRRPGSIRHVTLGIDEWEPEPEDLADLGAVFMNAEMDVAGPVLVTRRGVEVNDLGGFKDNVWKMSDEWDWLTQVKYKIMGMDEAMLSGDATINVESSGMTMFIERLLSMRDFMTHYFIIEKLCKPIARANGFVRRSQAELSHRVRVAVPRYGAGSSEYDKNLNLPTITYKKSLRPLVDQDKMDILSKVKEEGLPVTLEDWARASGHSLSDNLDERLDKDVVLHEKVAKYKEKIAKISGGASGEGGMGGEEGMMTEGSSGDADSIKYAAEQLAGQIRKDPLLKTGQFCDVKQADVGELLKRLAQSDNSIDKKKASALRFLVARSSNSGAWMLTEQDKQVLSEHMHNRYNTKYGQLSKAELEAMEQLASLCRKKKMPTEMEVSVNASLSEKNMKWGSPKELGPNFLVGRTPSFYKRFA